MTNETDEALMVEVRGGHLDRMGVLFHRHHQRMYRFFRRSIPDRSSCEDLVQNLFTRMIVYRSSYRGGGSFMSWVYRIAVNLRNDHLRRVRRERASYVADALEDAVSNPETTSGLDLVRLRAALDELRATERDVLVLTRFEGLSYADAAEVLGCTVGALKVRVHRALRSLREGYAKRRGAPWE